MPGNDFAGDAAPDMSPCGEETTPQRLSTGQPSFDAVAFDRPPEVEANLRVRHGIGALVVTHPEPWEADMPDHPEHVVLVRLAPSSAPVEVAVAGTAYQPRMPVGAFALLPAGAPSRWRDRGRGLRGLHVNLCPRVFGALLDEEGGPERLRGLPPIDWREDRVVAENAAVILDELSSPGIATRLAVESAACAIGVRLLRAADAGRRPGSVQRLSPARLARLRCYVEANLDRDLSLVELAAVVSLSPSHFARAFRATQGETPHAWVMSERIARATRLLHEGPLPIAEIALAAGFASQSHMTDVFRKRGLPSPGTWRRLGRSRG
jgi:AraC family transcriptional regulator